jgi:mannose-6-phosphate isomerase-like protein (cupin superfamily)
MRQLYEALEGLFIATSIAGGEAADDVNMAIDAVDWSADLTKVKAHSHPVVDAQIDQACDASIHEYGSNAHVICEALLAVRDQINWRPLSQKPPHETDIATLTRNYSSCLLIGGNAPLHSDKIRVGISLQGCDVYYPPHSHKSVERYWIVGGNGDWRINQEPWHPVEPGDVIIHEAGERHAMQTNMEPLLCVWLWSSDLKSKVKIDRGGSIK